MCPWIVGTCMVLPWCYVHRLHGASVFSVCSVCCVPRSYSVSAIVSAIVSARVSVVCVSVVSRAVVFSGCGLSGVACVLSYWIPAYWCLVRFWCFCCVSCAFLCLLWCCALVHVASSAPVCLASVLFVCYVAWLWVCCGGFTATVARSTRLPQPAVALTCLLCPRLPPLTLACAALTLCILN